MDDNDVIFVNGNPVHVPTGEFAAHRQPRTLIRFSGPVLASWRRRLVAAGIAIEFWCPPYGACVTLPKRLRIAALPSRFPFIAGAIGYLEAHCQRFDPRLGSTVKASPLPSAIVDVICFSKEHRKTVEAALARRRIRILSRASSKLRIWFEGDLAAIRDLPGVKLADHARLPKVLSAAEILGSIGVPVDASDRSSNDGRGEVIAVADTGLDVGVNDATLHPDFRGRVKRLTSLPPNESWLAFAMPRTDDAADRGAGHGTHVAGLALGSGAACDGLHCGVAPAATLVFQALEQDVAVKPEFQPRLPSGFYLAGRPLKLGDLFKAARRDGARIHVNSWGDPAQGAYTDDCHELDQFLYEHRDAVVLYATGNDGADRDGDQRIDGGSLYSPASAKNVIAVGATEGPLAGVGRRGTWGDLDTMRARWRVIGDRSDPISGEPTRIAPFSSCGPTRDGRIKPDLCAPGTNIPGPRSQASPLSGWGYADPLPFYMYDGGTSMAAGLAGGAAALVRQAWRKRSRSLSGAALKALLILGAVPVAARARGRTATPMEAGFGLIQVGRSLPSNDAGRRMVLQDVRRGGLNTGGRRSFRVRCAAGAKLRAVLCWYDPPGERLINDLDLSLRGPDGVIQHVGNPSAADGTAQPDRANTVEVVDAGSLAGGTYVLMVSGANVPAGPQQFALAYAVEQSKRS